MDQSDQEIISHLKPSKIVKIMKDPVASAKAVNLIYTSDAETAGIIRKKKGKKFSYYKDGEKIKDKVEITRINSLVIPPAWENVWICALDNGHLQATGFDALKRKQYRYHSLWSALRNHTKFYRMLQFGYALPGIRLQLEKDLALRNFEKRKILALVVSLMQRTNIRIGNSIYEKLYGSFGLTTLKGKHVKIQGQKINFSFKGKKGVMHNVDLKSKRLSKLITKCKEIPGKELFQYYDDEGNLHCIDSGMVNDYIKEISGDDFTAKDFRTWSGTVNALIAFKEIGYAENNAQYKKKVKEALNIVASHLGNTGTVCRKYYVHPLVINLYENNSIKKYLDALEVIEENDGKADLTHEEKLVLKILENEKM
ncbi:DNA topoisomerase IB [Chryseobacterium aquaticum]|jgi:DNA topoisomerase-1|uniref:DNA topoisomerase I n=3 Tax=Chryseobacterium group TaxID=2782232 RepID=A0A117KAX7_9FLAO|nr:DNA topoisomerase IB [Chryseobacterium aquaticum]KUJ55153.1 DNA topoisomerase I [Chryseobacterium aquaticum subsp. greenlandense]NMR34411.1 DNA topoisomerase IB [Chryseobacterium aquaticum]NRQ46605.1 DNA topoisomerase IB [Chryseobacterium sp. C-204]